MGLEKAFSENDADFSNMGKDNSGLFIASVQQKTFLQVDDLGTQAGVVTNVDMQEKCGYPIGILFNRPFVFAVIDTKTNLPLFLGAMENPNS